MFWFKLRKLLKSLAWLWAIGSFIFFWIMEKIDSQARGPIIPGDTLSHPITPTAAQIEAAHRMDWIGQILLPWALFGILPVIGLAIILYLLPKQGA